MSYTTVGGAKQKNQSNLQVKTLEFEEQSEDLPEEETPAAAAWKKYKALAAGTYAEENPDESDTNKTNKDTEEHLKTAGQAPAKEPPPPTGMAAIIQEYQKNKSQRSQMRSITVTTPKVFEEAVKAEEEKEDAKPQN